jgi:hypothetical protein
MNREQMCKNVESVIASHNENVRTPNAIIRIVWGNAEPALDSIAEAQYSALLNYFDQDYELEFTETGDPEYCPDMLTLSLDIEPTPFPTDSRLLYNLILSLDENVQPCVVPDYEEEEVMLVGLQTSLPVDVLTPRSMVGALRSLHSSARSIKDVFMNQGHDHWAENRHWYTEDDSDGGHDEDER